MLFQLSKSVLMLLVVVSSSAFAGKYNIDDRELDELKRSIESVGRDVRDLLRETGRDRRFSSLETQLQNIDDKILGRRGLLDWVSDVRRRGTEKEPAPAPRLAPFTVEGFYVVGKVDATDVGAAGRSHGAECTRWEAFLREQVGSSFDIFECGATTNVSTFSTSNYTQLASKPQFTVMVPEGTKPRTASTADIAGSTDSRNPAEAYESWAVECMKVIKAEKAKYAARFLAASCGEPKNVSKFITSQYKQYYSTGTVYLQN